MGTIPFHLLMFVLLAHAGGLARDRAVAAGPTVRAAETGGTMFAPPERLTAEVFARLPDALPRSATAIRRGRARQLHGAPTPVFLEGPSFDREGNLWVVDIPWGRIFRIDPQGDVDARRGVRRRAERPQVPPRRPRLHRRLPARHHGDGPAHRQGRALPGARAAGALQGLQRPVLRVERRPVLHRPGADRAARPERPAVSAARLRASSTAC